LTGDVSEETDEVSEARPAQGGEEKEPKRFGATKLLQFLVAAALLVFVVRMVPFTDALVWEAGEETYTVPGRIEGDWKSDAIEFEISADFDPPASWAPAARSELGPT